MSVGMPHATATATTTAALLTSIANENDGVLIANRGPEPVYVGGSTVTADESSTGGLVVYPHEKVTLPTVGGGTTYDIYVVTASGTAIVSWVHP